MMESMNNEKLAIQINGQKCYIEPKTLSFASNGKQYTLGELLDEVVELKAREEQFEGKLESYIKLESQAQKLIASAHDSLAIQLTDFKSELSDMNETIKIIKAKEGID